MLHSLRRLAVVLAATLVCASQSPAAVQLTEDGKALAVIVHNGLTELPPEMHGARDIKYLQGPAATLQDYLQQITGAELPLAADDAERAGRPAIVLQLTDAPVSDSGRATATQAYRIRTTADSVVLESSTHLGLQNAVYGFLEDHLGCRFYTFQRAGLGYKGTGFEVVPKAPSLTISEIDDLQEPAFANRGIIFWMGAYPWIAKNRGIGTPAGKTSGALAAGHSLYSLIPPTDKKVRGEVIPGLFAEHPEIYSLNGAGVREHNWGMGICGTNTDLPTFLAAGVEREIQSRLKRGKGTIDWEIPVSAGQGDGFNSCQCEPCRELVHREQSEAAPFVLALNRTLETMTETYPELRLITFAYFGTIDAPKTLKPHPRLWINVVSSDEGANAAGDQMGPIPGNPANADYARALAEWPKIAPGRVTVWHWDTYRAEWPSMFYVDDNVRYFRDNGLYGVNPQFCGGPWPDMLAWLYLKLSWNPDLDGDALIRQYCLDNYGQEAGAHVYDYLQIARDAYEANLYIPSAVRWAGWTPMLRVKMFPPSITQRMTAAMDQALAAAEAAGDETKLANLISARGQSLDVLMLNEVAYSGRPWGAVAAPDGKDWYVAGADPRVPPALIRAKRGIVADGGGEHGILRSVTVYTSGNGGPIVPVTGGAVSALVVPDLKGQIVSASAGDVELLAATGKSGGYMDDLGRITVQTWMPASENNDVARRGNDPSWATVWSDYQQESPDSVTADLVMSPGNWGFYPNQYLRRTVSSSDAGLTVTRQFVQIQTKARTLKNPTRANAVWRLQMPYPAQSLVAVKGGGIDQLLDLRNATAAGVTTEKAGEKIAGADWMDERFDTVIAVSAAETTSIDIPADATGAISISLDRGDGHAAVISIDPAGFDQILVKPIVDQQVLELTLVGAPLAMDGEAKTIDLPSQTLSGRTVPARVAPDATVAEQSAVKPVSPKVGIRVTSPTTAINEADGAELIWIPAGTFIRGSDDYADERPAKPVHLDGYWIYKYPVTLAQYQAYAAETGIEPTLNWGQAMHADEQPDDDGRYAMQTNWYEADSYAAYVGGALPTEAQWEKAARGTDGHQYPWGADWDPTKLVSNENTVQAFRPGFMPVDHAQQSVSPYGVVGTAGNVWEWVADWYTYDYYANSPDRNPTGPETGSHKVLRGGNALYDHRFSRATARMVHPPQVRDWTPVGFRCVINAPNPQAKAE